ncbi:MAG: CoA pyrophosphatase [Chloroflexi bacterium]|nr:CoA pyrophosphatase [Chloroflexota bacterium]
MPAAVLLPICQRDGDYYVLFTERTHRVEHHKGQISFPGGAWDEGDQSLVLTALRESAEEVGIRVDDVDVLGELDDVATHSNFLVSPVVGWIPYPYDFTINSDEVEKVIMVPLSTLLDKENVTLDPRVSRDRPYWGYNYNYEGQVIWGATAAILTQFLDVVFAGDPARP